MSVRKEKRERERRVKRCDSLCVDIRECVRACVRVEKREARGRDTFVVRLSYIIFFFVPSVRKRRERYGDPDFSHAYDYYTSHIYICVLLIYYDYDYTDYYLNILR